MIFIQILLNVNPSLNQTVLTFLLYVRHLPYMWNLDDSIDSGNISVQGYLPLIQKNSVTHISGLAVYVKEGLPFAQDLSLKKSCRLLLMFSTSFTLNSVLLLFPLSVTFFVFVHIFWCYFT